jgi:alpha-tubulin suppressor-like RCC1 family protein
MNDTIRYLSFGSGVDGQLAHGSSEDRNRPTPVNTESLDGTITSISCGANHTLALTDHGTVYTTAAATGSEIWSVLKTRVAVVDIEAGCDLSVVVHEHDRSVSVLKSDGSDGGQVQLSSVHMVRCGHKHFVAVQRDAEESDSLSSAVEESESKEEQEAESSSIIEEGESNEEEEEGGGNVHCCNVFAWGESKFGACGRVRENVGVAVTRSRRRFGRVASSSLVGVGPVLALTRVVGVACGLRHTLVVDVDGRVFAFGDNRCGQLALDAAECRRSATPVRVDVGDACARQVHANWSSGFAVVRGIDDVADAVVAWGRCDMGQLARARGDGRRYDERAMRVPLPPVEQLSCGAEHSAAVVSGGALLVWGWNEHGNLGTGDELNRFEPTAVELDDAMAAAVYCGGGHTFVKVTIR